MHRIAIAMTTCLFFAPVVAGAAHLALLVETETSCGGSVSWPPFTPLRGSIVAYPNAGDLRVVNFAIEAVPGIVTSYTPSALVASASGNPFGQGASVLLQNCQIGPSGVKLYDVTLVNTPVLFSTPVSFTFRPLSGMTCPTVSGCDLVAACVTGFVAPISAAPILTSPAMGVTGVRTNVQLQWQSHIHALCACVGNPYALVFFGTDPNPPQQGYLDYDGFAVSTSHFDPGPLQPLTTYYWRVEDWNCVAGASSTLGSFRTQDFVAVRANNWTAVKKLYK